MNSLKLAFKYLYKSKKQNSLKSLIRISVISIFFATLALTLSICVMSGFEESTIKKMRQLNYDLIIQSRNVSLNFPKISKILQEVENIDFFFPTSFQYGLLKNDLNNIITIKAINENDIILNTFDLNKSHIFENNSVIIGKKLAKHLDLKINDITNLKTFNLIDSNFNIKANKVKISGIFESGVEEFDTKMIIMSFSLFNKLFPKNGINQINILLKNQKNESETANQLRQILQLDILNWKELNPSLFSALKLEKYALSIVFILMLLISLTNISSLITLLITFKIRDISVLKVLGIYNFNIKLIFFYIGYFIVVISSCFGLFFAWLIGFLLKKYLFIELPDAYYSQYVPVSLDFKIFLLVFILLNLLGILVSYLSIKRVSKLNTLNSLMS